ncbi:hypothetical protein K501DRAFT_282650 [Backusella circina FSU 941]|nr:hypothetical protein K501DRAFT_282650 [Backusella circina FSU 941]
MTTNNPLDILNNLSFSSIGGIFQELVGNTKHSTPSITLHDTEGSDFKRLVNKKKQQRQQHPDVETNTTLKSTRFSNKASPDFRPVVHLASPPQPSKSTIGRSLYSLLFQHEDRYFNHDRQELSQDIFPVGKGPSCSN